MPVYRIIREPGDIFYALQAKYKWLPFWITIDLTLTAVWARELARYRANKKVEPKPKRYVEYLGDMKETR